MIDRRKFLISAAFAASGALMPLKAVKAAVTGNDALERITAAMNENISLNNCTPLDEDDLHALAYAYRTIRPVSHVEHAVVVACGRASILQWGITDEYVRRKKGEEPEFFNHPILHLKKLGVPDTQGLFIFKEQVDWFLAEIISEKDAFNLNDGILLRKKIGMGKMCFAEFYNYIHPRYRAYMSDQDVYDLLDLLRSYLWCDVYICCSAIVARAGF